MSMAFQDPARRGIKWEMDMSDTMQPHWTTEVRDTDVYTVVVKALRKSFAGPVRRTKVRLLAQGVLNKTYLVETDHGDFIMRVALPVEPLYKMVSHVATMECVRQKAQVPLPRVIAFSTSKDNEAQQEWILMERAKGRGLRDCWLTMSWPSKLALARRMAKIIAELWTIRSYQCGNLYHRKHLDQIEQGDRIEAFGLPKLAPELEPKPRPSFLHHLFCREPTGTPEHSIGRIISTDFFWAHRYLEDVPRGPYSTARDYLLAKISLLERDLRRKISTNDVIPREQKTRAEQVSTDLELSSYKALTSRERPLAILLHLHAIVSRQRDRSVFRLCHARLDLDSVLVDEASGKLSSIIDWEWATMLPEYLVAGYPAWMEAPLPREHHHRPRPREYGVNRAGFHTDGSRNAAYDSELGRYELFRARHEFKKTMRAVQPEWVAAHEDVENQRMSDIDHAITLCASLPVTFPGLLLRAWLLEYDKFRERNGGSYLSLQELVTLDASYSGCEDEYIQERTGISYMTR